MPRKSKGARLYLDKRSNREAQWIIRDGAHRVRTSCSEADRRGAESALADYLARKYQPQARHSDVDRALIAEALAFYLKERAPHLADPTREATAASFLLDFWGDHSIAEIRGETCRAYAAKRVMEDGKKSGTARRELETLQAAINLFHREGYVTTAPRVTLPPKAPPKERWLSRSEARSLLESVETLEKGSRHIGTFVRLGLYTGTRMQAILSLQWQENSDGGWIDLDRKILYRRGLEQSETRKRRPPSPIPEVLMPWLAETRGLTGNFVVEYRGKPVRDIRLGFQTALERAGLGRDVTPHVLRHTCGTWLAQAGVPIWQAAGYMGLTVAEFERTYAHHHPDYMRAATDAISDALKFKI